MHVPCCAATCPPRAVWFAAGGRGRIHTRIQPWAQPDTLLSLLPHRIEYRFDGFKLLLPWRRGGAAPAAGGLSAAAGGGEGIGGKGGGSSRSAVLRREQRDEARLALPLPTPRAGGWTQGVFVDSEVRVMRNSQGDTLIFVREE